MNIISAAPLSPRVKEAIPMEDYMLLITFVNGEQRIFDANPLLKLPAFKPLSNKELFQSVKVAYGTITWPPNIDYCPDTLYQESTEWN